MTGAGMGPGTASGPDAVDDEQGPRPVLAGWVVERRLGRGGSATVWLVRSTGAADGGTGNTPDVERAALKIAHENPTLSADTLDHEVRAIGELRHDHLVLPYGVVPTDRGPGLLSQYLAGGSLGALVRAGGPLPVEQVVTVLVPVAQALEALHARGVVHGDISPGNVLFGLDGRPAVADLGAARLLGGLGVRTGTPGFMAPEILLGPAPGETEDRVGGVSVDFPSTRERFARRWARAEAAAAVEDGRLETAADVYALAALGWYALTGRSPSSPRARAPLRLLVPEVDSDVVALLEAGLDEDPAARPSAGHFAAACYQWATPEPLDLYASAPLEVAAELPTRPRHQQSPGRRSGRRRRADTRTANGTARRLGRGGSIIAALVACAVAATILATVVLGGTDRAGDPAADRAVDDPADSTTDDPPTSAAAGVTSEAGPSVHEPPAAASDPSPDTAGTADETAGETADTTPDAALVDAAGELGRARTIALTSLAAEDVDAYAVDDSPAQRADREVQQRLSSAQLRYEGLRMTTTVVDQPRTVDERTAQVPLELTISEHRTVDVDGEPVTVTQDPSTEEFVVVMTLTDEGWKVERIEAGPGN